MIAFWKTLIAPLLEARAARVIVEVGVLGGDTTVKLLEYAEAHDCVVHAIDPAPAAPTFIADLQQRFGQHFVFHQEKSLEALPKIDEPHAVLIDGDHNWYTVVNELRVLAAAAEQRSQPFPLTFLHDIGWPYGRRDSYYDPDAIPPEYRQPFRKAGLVPGMTELSQTSGINLGANNALIEGTDRNGVLTAVEDFLTDTDLALVFKTVAGYNGLGIIVTQEQLDSSDRLRAALAELESPAWLAHHCTRLEESRIHHLAEASALGRELRARKR